MAAYYRATRTLHWWTPEGIYSFFEEREYNLEPILRKSPELWDKIMDRTLVPVPFEPAPYYPLVEIPNRLARILTLDLV